MMIPITATARYPQRPCRSGTGQPGNGNATMTLIMTALEIPPIRNAAALSCAIFFEIFEKGRSACLHIDRALENVQS
jgi:hypothetical protein